MVAVLGFLVITPFRTLPRMWLIKEIVAATEIQADRGAGIAWCLELRTRDRKVASSNPGRSGGRIFFSRVNCVCRLFIPCPLHPRDTAAARKRLRSFCQNAGGRLHLNTHSPLTQRSRSGLTMPLSRHNVGNLSQNELTSNSIVIEHSVTVVSAR